MFCEHNRQNYKGTKVDIGGYKIHMYETKNPEGPTVVFDAGRGCNYLAWHSVQGLASQFIETVSFDRAGLGWSDPSPYPRTSSNIVEEMKEMLDKSAIAKPYILVGHSFGGINVLLYACYYPQDVYGIVLVDSCHEDQLIKLPRIKENFRLTLKIQQILVYLNLYKLFYLNKKDINLESEIDWGLYSKYVDRKYFKTFYEEYQLFKQSLEQLKTADQEYLLNKPLTVISAGIYNNNSKDWATAWSNLQKDLVTKSNKGKHIIAKDSGHMIVKSNPEIIVNAIRELQMQY